MTIAQHPRRATKGARVLVVEDEPSLLELFRDSIAGPLHSEVSCASTLAEAHRVISRQAVDVMVTDIMLPDGSGLSLLNELHRVQPEASAVVMTGAATAQLAVEALRGGAVDFLPKPFTTSELADRVAKAIASQQSQTRQHQRMERLRATCKRLHTARRIVSKRVDLLCNDLISAYGELAKRFETARLEQTYRQCVEPAPNLEQLLCHTMDWLLRQAGYCNIGLWLMTENKEMQLGAYMKYTVPAETPLVSAMQENLLRMIMRRGFVRIRQPEAKSHLTPLELKHLGGADLMGVNCTYLGETLGVMVMFRDHQTPFRDEDVNALKTISPLFALALAQAVRGSESGGGEEGGGATASDEPKAKPKRKNDPADWWKTGGPPPF